MKGYVAANNEGGNFYQLISLVDNTGEANTGIIIKGSDYTEKDLPVGTKVIVSLKYAKYDINNDLPQLRMATIFPTQEKVTMKVPQITVSQAGDYVGQYVTVKNLTPAANSTTWVVNKKTTSVNFTDDAELPMVARTTNHAVFANEAIAIKKADLSGIMEIYKGGLSDLPQQHGGRCRLQSRVTRHNPSVCKKIPASSNPQGFSVSKRGQGRGGAEDLRAVYSMELKNNR